MPENNLPPDKTEKMKQMYELIKWQDEKITELESRLISGNQDKNPAEKFFDIYREFIQTVNEQGVAISRKYSTENSRKYIDAPYQNFREFVSEHLDKEEHRRFKEFLKDFQLVESGTFDGSGLYANTKEAGRTRVVRIRSDVCKWIS